jgi:hypothetical protein
LLPDVRTAEVDQLGGLSNELSSSVAGSRSRGRSSRVRRHLLLVADAFVSLVVSKLQEARLDQPVSPAAMQLRREYARGQFLQELRELEHFANAKAALCRVLVEGDQPGGRIPFPHRPVEDAQSESSAILFLVSETRNTFWQSCRNPAASVRLYEAECGTTGLGVEQPVCVREC